MTIDYSKDGLFLKQTISLSLAPRCSIAIEDTPFDAPADGQDFYLAVIRHCRELEDSSFHYGYGAELVSSFGSAVFHSKEPE